MKITTEKLPKSLLSLQIELDKERFERGLDQAARRLSQKYPVHGFRPGKAPRFMIERTFGREALIEEASEDLINKAFRDALKEQAIEPVGQASLQGIDSPEPFTFTVHVPVEPTVDVGDYRAISVPLELDEVTDEQVERAMDVVRDRHVVLKELDEPRPAQEGDQLKVMLATVVDDGAEAEADEAEADDAEVAAPKAEADDAEVEVIDAEVIDADADDDENETSGEQPSEQTLDLVKGRLVDELHDGLIGLNVGDKKEIVASMPADHANEEVRGKTVTFKVEVLGIQERMVPEWDELTTLENFEGSLDELRAKTRADLEKAARTSAERKTIDAYIEQLVEQTSYDIPDVMIHDLAHQMLHDQERQFSRYGITLDQMLQFRGQSHEEAIEALEPDAERQTKVTLALREVVRREGLETSEDEIEVEMSRMLEEYDEGERDNVAQILQSQLRSSVANSALDRKLRERLVLLATGATPALPEVETSATPAADSEAEAEPEAEPATSKAAE